MRAKPTSAPTDSTVEPISDELMQVATPTNVNNLSATRQPANTVEEPITLLTSSNIEALVSQEKASTASLDWRLPYFRGGCEATPLRLQGAKIQEIGQTE